MNKLNKKGFTLIEMLVVIAIIAILVAIIVPTVASSTLKAKGAADAANFRSMAAEAAIDYMNGSGTAVSKPFSSKVYACSGTIEFSADSGTGALVGVAKGGAMEGKTLDDFVKIAETGKKPA